MKTKPWAIITIILSTVFISFAQVLYKFGALSLEPNILKIMTNIPLIAGVILYGISALMLIISLRGGDLSVLYPFIAATYIWVSLLSMYFFGETMNLWKWGGIAMIILGVIFIGVGGNRE